jgi:glycosyltransferase involved in cell wall biosynthesis
MKSYISYVPHGINHNNFFPIHEDHTKFEELQQFKSKLLGGKNYSFVLLFNSRNIRRKQIPDTLLAFKTFLDDLNPILRDQCCIVLHTQPVDDNGTDLYAVREMLFGDKAEHHVIFSQEKADINYMNLLYNSCTGTILISSNEGWGLSITETLMCGKPAIINVTGGLQDQARFEDDNGKWLDMTETFSSNHLSKYKKCGNWVFPVFPSNLSIQGSPMTPYILDDRADYRDVAEQIRLMYDMSNMEDENGNILQQYGLQGRAWVTSDESGMSARKMCDNMIKSIDHVFENWEGREPYEVIQIEPRKKKFVKHPISY